MGADRWIERNLWSDVGALYRQRRLAWSLYTAEVAELQRTSGLGLLAPFMSVILYTVVLGSVMALVFGTPINDFLPFFAISFPLWQAISTVISEAAYANEKSARFLSFPNISSCIVHLISGYGLLVNVTLKLSAACIVVAVISPRLLLEANYPAAFVGIAAMTLALLTWTIPMSFIFDRIRLFRGLLPQMLMAVYLVTPILWQPERLASHPLVYEINPMFHLVEVVRGPLLSGTLPLGSLAVCLSIGLIGIVISRIAFEPNRRQIVYSWIA